MQSGRLQQARAVGRGDAYLHRVVVPHHLQYDLAAGRAARPDPAPERGEARYRLVAYREDAIARAQPGLDRRTPLRQPGHDDRVVDLGRIEAEPRPRRPI